MKALVPVVLLVALPAVGTRDAGPAVDSADAAASAFASDTVRTTSDWLALLPDGETKRRFILDCAGCHPLDDAVMTAAGALRTREDWTRAVDLMLSFAGGHTGFPIMAPSRESGATAAWLVQHLTALPPAPSARPAAAGWEVTEFPLPRTTDLPHDVGIAHDGRVIVTGMMSNVLYALDPRSGSFEELPLLPAPGANPRAIEIGPDGAWWVVLGGPTRLARRDPDSGAWRSWNVGVYPHEAAVDSSGRAWFNGHFTKEPEILGHVDPAAGGESTVTFDAPVPAMDDGGSTIPYGLRVAPDGTIWMTELTGGRLIGLDPATGEFRVHPLPEPFSGPRRLDVAADGTVWIPEFASGRLAAFDPATSQFREYPIPIPDALPYVARVDRRSGAVWVSLAGAGALARFDPSTEAFEIVPLPTKDGIVRHLAIDPRTGDLWGAYGSFPARSQHVFRVRPR
jgi:virginiamycin B lyase